MTKTDRDSVERLAGSLEYQCGSFHNDDCTSQRRSAGDTLRALLDRIGFLEVDFDDCNSERARWKARAEQAEAKLADVWDEAIEEADLSNVLDRIPPNPYRSEANDTEE